MTAVNAVVEWALRRKALASGLAVVAVIALLSLSGGTGAQPVTANPDASATPYEPAPYTPSATPNTAAAPEAAGSPTTAPPTQAPADTAAAARGTAEAFMARYLQPRRTAAQRAAATQPYTTAGLHARLLVTGALPLPGAGPVTVTVVADDANGARVVAARGGRSLTLSLMADPLRVDDVAASAID